jgi:hypothetical protein
MLCDNLFNNKETIINLRKEAIINLQIVGRRSQPGSALHLRRIDPTAKKSLFTCILAPHRRRRTVPGAASGNQKGAPWATINARSN